MSEFISSILQELGICKSKADNVSRVSHICSHNYNIPLFKQGQRITKWNYILNGSVILYAPFPEGNRTPMCVYSEGCWFGDQNIILDQPSLFEYRPLGEVELIEISMTIFLDILQTEANFSKNLYSATIWRAEHQMKVTFLVKKGDPFARVLMGIALIAETLLTGATGKFLHRDVDFLKIPLSQELLAQFLGSSRTVVSKHLLKLQCDGALEVGYSHIRLLNLPMWVRLIRRTHGMNYFLSDTSFDNPVETLLAYESGCVS